MAQAMSVRAPSFKRVFESGWTGAAVWLVPLLVISVPVALRPLARTVTPIYHGASAHWWAGADLYRGGPTDFNYLPVFALLFAPFHALPVPVGDLLWRALATGLLATGIWRVVRAECGAAAPKAYLWASLLAMPACTGAMRNGQGSALFAGLVLHALVCTSRRQWWWAAALAALSVAARPLGLVLVLLAPAIYAPLRWRLAVCLGALAVLPFAFAPAAYVIGQHYAFADNIHACADYDTRYLADITGILRPFYSGDIPARVHSLMSLLAGAATLGLCWCLARRLREPFRALWVLVLATGYLMLFNPMNEVNSYVIFGPALGLWAVFALRAESTRRSGWVLVAIAVSLEVLPRIFWPWLGKHFAPFWHPLMTVVVLGVLTRALWRDRAAFVALPVTAPAQAPEPNAPGSVRPAAVTPPR